MTAPSPPIAQLQAPASWHTADVMSDLHLHEGDPATFDVWRHYMTRTRAGAVFILGDLFEAWAGDDAALEPGFAAECAAVLRATSARLPVFFMHGNRDFLIGEGFLRSCHTELLADPTVLDFAGRRWLMTHGDALCLSDSDYLEFRRKVRAAAWQRDFMSKPLQERLEIARDLRRQSEARKRSDIPCPQVDVDSHAALAWLEAAGGDALVHGHTHRPGDHPLGTKRRIVLSDWDAASTPPRLQVLRLGPGGAERVSLA